MGNITKSYPGRGKEKLAKMNAAVRRHALSIVRAAMADAAAHPEQVVLDSKERKSLAPFYLHMATAIAADSVKKEAEKVAPTQNMNVVIVGQAASKDAWLEAVNQLPRLSAIDAAVVVKDKEPAK